MEKRSLGKNGPRVSALGFGCMGMSDFYGIPESTRNDAESLATLQKALDAGIDFVNTADFYGMGRGELLLGEALKGRREKPLVSVKFGVLRTPTGGFGGLDTRPQAVKNFAAYSLTRLGLDSIGIYQPARLDPSVPVEDTVGAIADLIKEGKVRYLGLSEATPEILRRAHKVHPVTAVEVEYSLATRIIEHELLATARELGVGVVAYGVLSRGLLSGALTGRYEPGDFRSHAPRFTGENFEANQRQVAVLEDFARSKGATPSQVAIAWVLRRGEDIVPLLGTTRRDRLQENLGSLDIRFSPEDLARLDEAFPEGAIRGERYPAQQMALVVH